VLSDLPKQKHPSLQGLPAQRPIGGRASCHDWRLRNKGKASGAASIPCFDADGLVGIGSVRSSLVECKYAAYRMVHMDPNDPSQ
jgi:hypothetical protein